MLVTGDTPAISKILHLTGHNGYSPCRFCTIKGTPYQKKYKMKDQDVERLKTTYYYPLNPPTNVPPAFRIAEAHHVYDPLNLPRRTNTGFLSDATDAENDPTGKTARETGIKSRSILFRIPSIRFPYSFPIDVMHLIYLGLTRDIVALLNGSYFSSGNTGRDTSRPFCLSEKVWREIGKEMGSARIPTGFGRQTRNIDKYIKSFKSEECATFLHNLALHLLHNRVSNEVYVMLMRLILGISLSINYTVHDTNEIRSLLNEFVSDFYRIFYRQEYEMLRVCKYTIHSVLHIADCLDWWGSAANFWQYPEERFCGMLVSAVKSRVHGSTNLSILMHQQQLLHLAASFGWIPLEGSEPAALINQDEDEETTHVTRDRLPLKQKILSSEHEFLTPRRLKRLTDLELRHLRKHYITRYSFPPNSPQTRRRLENIDKVASIWGRCLDYNTQTTYNSQFAQRKKLGGRLNSFACFEQEVDVNARYREETRGEQMVPVEFFGDIQHFILHEFEGVEHALVYVQWIHHRVVEGLVQDEGGWAYEFTGVESLKRLVGRVTVGVRPVKTFVVEEVCEEMIERLRDALL